MCYHFKKFLSIARDLIFVPRCASCDERLSPIPEKGNLTYNKICFCQKCGENWERAKARMCIACGNISENCDCAPSYFFKYQPNIPSLCFYDPNSSNTESKTIITLKRKNDDYLFEFLAIELYPKLNKTLEKMNIDGKSCLFTWVPRSRRSAARSGFDQGKKLAKLTSKLFGANIYPLFLRVGGREQKTLNKLERRKNAQVSIKLNSPMHGFRTGVSAKNLAEFIRGKNVIIIDDVLTSGETLRRASELLKSEGAESVIVACIAKTANKTAKEG